MVAVIFNLIEPQTFKLTKTDKKNIPFLLHLLLLYSE